jgi:1-acyl-sn-glycerol-3-phosphate acyltransferase
LGEKYLRSDTDSSTPLLVQVLRACQIVLHFGVQWVAAITVVPWLSPARRRAFCERYALHLLNILNVRVVALGATPLGKGPLLVIANHISWLDIFVLHSLRGWRFVSALGFAKWPFIGTIAKKIKTFFLRSGSLRDLQRVKNEVTEALKNGDDVAIFPERKTTDGDCVGHFHSSLLQAAIDAGVPVVPVAIRYRTADGNGNGISALHLRSGVVRKDKEASLWESLTVTLRLPPLRAEVTICEPIMVAGKDRLELTRSAREMIAKALGLPHDQADYQDQPESRRSWDKARLAGDQA